MARSFEVQGSSPVLAGVVWEERYNCYDARLFGWLGIGFSWEGSLAPKGSSYKVTVAGRTLKARAADPASAAKLAVETARRWCAHAAVQLEKTLVEGAPKTEVST